MHAILSTLGTAGDVLPHIGLGARLRARGHHVTLAAPEPFRDLAESEGLAFHPLVTTPEFDEMIAHPHLFHPLLSGRMMARWGARFLRRHYDALADLTASSDAVLVTNPGVLPARLVQEKLRRPTATLLLQPGIIPSTCAPPEMPAGLTLPRGLPRSVGHLYWAAIDTAGYLLVARPLNRLRKTLGLPPVRRLFQWWLSPDLVIALFPAAYAPPQPDWPPQLRLTGFGHYDGPPTAAHAPPLPLPVFRGRAGVGAALLPLPVPRPATSSVESERGGVRAASEDQTAPPTQRPSSAITLETTNTLPPTSSFSSTPAPHQSPSPSAPA